MLEFVKRKLLNKKWMAVSLLIGNILLVAIASSGPMYSQAALQRMLNRDLNQYIVEMCIRDRVGTTVPYWHLFCSVNSN